MQIKKFDPDNPFYLVEILDLAQMMNKESPMYQRYKLKEDYIVWLANESVHNNEVFGRMAVNNQDTVVGFICGHAGEHHLVDMMIASDIAFYVHPDHRGSSAAYRLVKSMEEWAQEIGVDRLMLAQSTGNDPRPFIKLLSRLGFDSHTTPTFIKEYV